VTNPPPPGNWGPPQSGPQPPYGQGQWGPPQQGWGPPPTPPKNNSLKWLLIGVAVLLVVAISVGATLLFTRDGGDSSPTATGTSPAPGEIASANDTGPVAVITEDPTCEPWRPIITTLSNQQRQGWDKRDHSLPRSAWSLELQQTHEATAQAMQRAADQVVALVPLTPHRVMRELYEQSIAYWRAYADSIPAYSSVDNSLAVTASDTSDAITSICAAIDNGAASARRPLVTDGEAPSSVAAPSQLPSPARFIDESAHQFCTEWSTLVENFENETSQWREWDAASPSTAWTPEHRGMMEMAAIKMTEFATDIEAFGRTGENPAVEDFSALSAQYFRAYAQSIPTYSTADSYLSSTGTLGYLIVFNACAAENA
jgi:hypothetical protein